MTKRLSVWIGLVLALHVSCAFCAAPGVTTLDIPSGGAGVPYTLTLSATAGSPPYAWSLSAGALPPGLALSAAGVISGTPTAAGSAAFTVLVADSAGKSVSKGFTQSIVPAPPANVPAAYADLYAELQGQLDAFNTTVNTQWDGSKSSVAFAAELLDANGNRGLQLLTARPGILKELDALKKVGVKAVTFNVPFPILYQPFYTFNGDPADYQNMLNFYTQLAADIRSRGMKIVVESHAMFGGVYSQGSGFNLAGYYPTLAGNFNGYVAARAQNVTVVAQTIKPDWLSIANEPDTEQTLSGQPINNVANFTLLTNTILSSLSSAGVTGVKTCAGVGTWMNNPATFINAIVSSTSVDSVDLHIYPVNRNFLMLALTLADTIRAGGKSVSISEAWMSKEREAELGTINSATDPTIFARDEFSFWAPLDQEFITCLAKFSHFKQLDYCSFFWSQHFDAYLDYDTIAALNPPPTAQQLMTLEGQAAGAALASGQLTSTGLWYQTLINPPALAITTSALSGGAIDAPFRQSVQAGGGIPPYSFSLSAGALPAGMTFSADGTLNGAPSAAGQYTLTIQVRDDFKTLAAQQFTLTIVGAPSIDSAAGAAPNPAAIGQMVSFSVAASSSDGSALTYAWNFGDGTNGDGASTTHAYASAGTFNATVIVANASGLATTSTVSVIVTGSGSGGGDGGGNGGGDGSGGSGNGGGGGSVVAASVSKFQATVSMTGGTHDTCSISGTLPDAPKLFDPTAQTIALNVSGVAASFTLDKNGRAHSAQGSIALKFKPALRNKSTHKLEFQGGNVAFTLHLLHGAWAQTWSLTPASAAATMQLTATLGGVTYQASVNVRVRGNAKSVRMNN